MEFSTLHDHRGIRACCPRMHSRPDPRPVPRASSRARGLAPAGLPQPEDQRRPSLRPAGTGSGRRLRIRTRRRRTLLGHHPAPTPRRVDRRRRDGEPATHRTRRLRPHDRPRTRPPERRRLYHQGALRWRMRRQKPSRPRQTRPETLPVDDGTGIPLVAEPAPANTRDHTLLPATLDRFTALEQALGPLPEHPRLALDAGYDYQRVHDGLADRRIDARIAPRGAKIPIQTGGRWVVERTNSWMNNFGKLRRCTERRRTAVEFFLALAATIITVRCRTISPAAQGAAVQVGGPLLHVTSARARAPCLLHLVRSVRPEGIPRQPPHPRDYRPILAPTADMRQSLCVDDPGALPMQARRCAGGRGHLRREVTKTADLLTDLGSLVQLPAHMARLRRRRRKFDGYDSVSVTVDSQFRAGIAPRRLLVPRLRPLATPWSPSGPQQYANNCLLRSDATSHKRPLTWASTQPTAFPTHVGTKGLEPAAP